MCPLSAATSTLPSAARPASSTAIQTATFSSTVLSLAQDRRLPPLPASLARRCLSERAIGQRTHTSISRCPPSASGIPISATSTSRLCAPCLSQPLSLTSPTSQTTALQTAPSTPQHPPPLPLPFLQPPPLLLHCLQPPALPLLCLQPPPLPQPLLCVRHHPLSSPPSPPRPLPSPPPQPSPRPQPCLQPPAPRPLPLDASILWTTMLPAPAFGTPSRPSTQT
mmetsp:Transcript_25875/g.42481  ORF Transcript_25875/g.42481 Transcript_25875/m.42481 type:complete len:223 (-) Transcript_25875:2-670(-)